MQPCVSAERAEEVDFDGMKRDEIRLIELLDASPIKVRSLNIFEYYCYIRHPQIT